MITNGTFKIGDKVKCVRKVEPYYKLTIGKEYLVSEDSQWCVNEEFVGIDSDDDGDCGHCFPIECFEKVDYYETASEIVDAYLNGTLGKNYPTLVEAIELIIAGKSL